MPSLINTFPKPFFIEKLYTLMFWSRNMKFRRDCLYVQDALFAVPMKMHLNLAKLQAFERKILGLMKVATP